MVKPRSISVKKSGMPTKQERLDAYRAGVRAGALMSKDDMFKDGEKASALVIAMLGIAQADKKDAQALIDLLRPLMNYVAGFCNARDRYFDAIKAGELPDAGLQIDFDKAKRKREFWEPATERKLIANKTARRSRKVVSK